MRDLLQFPCTIYDTNCIVYYCFKIETQGVDGAQVVILGPETQKARDITSQLVKGAKTVCTLIAAWTEVANVLARALQALINEGYIGRELGTNKQISPTLRFQLLKSLQREMVQLDRTGWFSVVRYSPTLARMREVRDLYAQFARNPAMHHRIPPNKGDPSNVDISLILYSGHARLPLLTNDREISNFAPELREHGFCELIKPFREVKFK